MPGAGGLALIVLGAILRFAVTGSIPGIDLPAVGLILMIAGALVSWLPLLAHNRSGTNGAGARSHQDTTGGPQT
jgi:hypothetical protein